MEATAPAPTLERQGTHALLTTALSVALGLLSSIVVARTLGPEGKGILDVASATAALFSLVLGGSLNVALTHLVARHGGHPPGLVIQLAAWSLGAAALTTLCLALRPDFTAYLGLLPRRDTWFWLGFVVGTVAFGIWAGALRGILIGRHALIAVNRIDLAAKAAILLAYVTLAAGSWAQPKSFAFAGLAAAIALTIAVVVALPPSFAPVSRLPPPSPSSLLPFPASGWWPVLLAAALPMHATNVLHFLNQRADIFFVQAWHGSGEVGRYALAVSLAQIVLLASSAFAQPLLPAVSAASSSAAAINATTGVCRQFMALALPGSAALAAGAWLVPLVFGRDFSGSIPSLLTLLPGIVAYGLMVILISYFAGVGRSRINLAISALALVVTAVGNLWLTRRYGALGAALTSTVAYLLAGGVTVAVFVRQTGTAPLALLWPTAADWHNTFARVARLRL